MNPLQCEGINGTGVHNLQVDREHVFICVVDGFDLVLAGHLAVRHDVNDFAAEFARGADISQRKCREEGAFKVSSSKVGDFFLRRTFWIVS